MLVEILVEREAFSASPRKAIAVSQTGDRQGSTRIVFSSGRSRRPSNCFQHSDTSAESSEQPIARSATILQTIGGKIAPRPSLPSNRSSIHCRHAMTARRRSGRKPMQSTYLITASTIRKNRDHASFPPIERLVVSLAQSAKSSSIPMSCGNLRIGLKAHINERGTIIVRDQAETR